MAKGKSDKPTLAEKPRVVVGLDFGTTYSGFAYAHVSNPERIYTYYDYPKNVGEKPYCKTLTACYYKPLVAAKSRIRRGVEPKATWKLQSWGYPAYTDYERDVQVLEKYQKTQEQVLISSNGSSAHTFQPGESDLLTPLIQKAPSEGGFLSRLKLFNSQDTSQYGTSHGVAPLIPQTSSVGVFLVGFKLHLAGGSIEASYATPLPQGLTIAQVITDYLRELGGLILKHLQSKYGAHFSNEMVQWCITVPSIWGNFAKHTMRTCMEAAGLVSAHHSVTMVLEPEATSFHCQRWMSEVVLEAGNKLLVVDIGGGTLDIVVQEVVKPRCQMKEVTMSSGGLYGGAYVDSRFMEFLKRKVGEACVSECVRKHPNMYGQLMKEWRFTKSIFDRNKGMIVMNLPSKLAAEWKRSDLESSHRKSREYGQLEISSTEMQSIFDQVVQQNVDLIQRQIVEAGGKVRVLAMVGGFLESPYLLRKMREAFEAVVENIICPPNPGSVVCQGAVALAFNPNVVVSRICTRTYGYRAAMPFEKGIDPIGRLLMTTMDDGTHMYDERNLCGGRFKALVKKGDVVVMDKAVTNLMWPFAKDCKSAIIEIFSCDDRVPPRYITDKGMHKEGELVRDIPRDMKLKTRRNIELSLCFKRSSLEVIAQAVIL